MNNPDIRWRQRFQNFAQSLTHLEQAVRIPAPDIVQRAGLIQFFEVTFELSWKLLKDYLEEQGFIGLKSPREVLKKAFEVELISEGHQWLQLLQDRNLTSHTYNEAIAREVEGLIRETYYPLFNHLHDTFAKHMDTDSPQDL
ncbi:MAG: nucleotidyltransferase substrate binding protein [Chloroflexi bacterium]|nr:nucleotidyltransferase substrate binding protein [Chloroflexota bacterium]